MLGKIDDFRTSGIVTKMTSEGLLAFREGDATAAGAVADMSTAPFYLLVWAKSKPRRMLVEVVENVSGSSSGWRSANVEDLTTEEADALLSAEPVITTDENGNQTIAEHGWSVTPTYTLRAAKAGHSPTPFSLSRVKAENPEIFRAQRIAEVDSKTERLIDAGFSYNGKTFSTSRNAQLTYIGMYTGRALLSYPVTVNTLGDEDTEELADETEVEAFYTAFVTSMRAALDSGTALKTALRAATTETEVLAVMDDR